MSLTAAARATLADLVPATVNNTDLDVRLNGQVQWFTPGLALAVGPECTDVVLVDVNHDAAIPGWFVCWSMNFTTGRREFAGHLSPDETRALLLRVVDEHSARAAA